MSTPASLERGIGSLNAVLNHWQQAEPTMSEYTTVVYNALGSLLSGDCGKTGRVIILSLVAAALNERFTETNDCWSMDDKGERITYTWVADKALREVVKVALQG